MLMKVLATSEITDDYAPAPSAPRYPVRRMPDPRWWRVLGEWIERSRQRHALAGLDNRLLDDVGITRSQAAREIAKPFWR